MKNKITFTEFIKRNPDQIPKLEILLGKKWNGEKFV